jgi:hypothetical protein
MSQISKFIAQSGPMSMSLVARSTIADDISAPSKHHYHHNDSLKPELQKEIACSPNKIPPFSLVLDVLGQPPASGEQGKKTRNGGFCGGFGGGGSQGRRVVSSRSRRRSFGEHDRIELDDFLNCVVTTLLVLF